MSNKKLAERLNEIVTKASSKKSNVQRTIAYLCEEIPGLSLNAIERFTYGADEPTLDQTRAICVALGASFDYLWRGDGSPFSYHEDFPPMPNEYLPFFRDRALASVVFVRGSSMPHPGYVVLQFNEYRFRVLPAFWHVSSENGGGGSKALVELAQLSENIHRTRSYEPVVRGIEVSTAIAHKVFYGELHASSLWTKGWKSSYWWDDIADVDHRRVCAREYASRYDREFFAAQELIKWSRAQEQPSA